MLALAGASFATGCSITPPPVVVQQVSVYTPPKLSDYAVRVINLCDSFDPYIAMWKTEVARRFPGAVMICGHGSKRASDGEWTITPDTDFPFIGTVTGNPVTVRAMIEVAKEQYPGRLVVVLSCNPGHVKLDIPGVAYPNESFWLVPDKNLPRNVGTDNVANVFEFTFNP